MFSRITWLFALASLPLLAGCGSDPQEEYHPGHDDVLSSIRSILEDVEKTGQRGSAYEALAGEIEKLHEFDAAKADQLEAKYEQMEQASSPSQLKTEAKEAKAQL